MLRNSEITFLFKTDVVKVNENLIYLILCFSLFLIVTLQVSKQPNKHCILFGDEKLTYLDVDKQGNKLAHYLRNTKLLKVNHINLASCMGGGERGGPNQKLRFGLHRDMA